MYLRIVHLCIAIAVSGCAALMGCGNAGSPAVVSIQSIEPSGESPLLEGDRVVFVVTVRAQGFDQPGKVGVLVQSEGNILASSELVSIESGATATLRLPVAVPDVSSMQVVTPLYIGEAERSSIVDRRNYKVVGRRG
jgi:hypothetical protein